MKKKFIYTAILSSLILVSCGGTDSSNENLDALIAKRDSLKNELTLINQKIAALDTSKADLLPLVTVSKVE